MTVLQLQYILAQYPDDMPVYIWECYNDCPERVDEVIELEPALIDGNHNETSNVLMIR